MTNYSYRVTLSCGHVWFIPKPLPALGDTKECRQCDEKVTVTSVDARELELYCPDCNRVIERFHILAKLTADTAKSVHNHRDKRGHHAEIRFYGDYLTNAANG